MQPNRDLNEHSEFRLSAFVPTNSREQNVFICTCTIYVYVCARDPKGWETLDNYKRRPLKGGEAVKTTN